MGLLFLVIIAIVYFTVVAREQLFPPTMVVRGIVHDLRGEPVAGARVFTTLDIALNTITDRRGRFELWDVPAEERSVIVVLEDVGQQYSVPRGESAAADLGTLVYEVPRLYERMTPKRRSHEAPATVNDRTAASTAKQDE